MCLEFSSEPVIVPTMIKDTFELDIQACAG